jgi:hypothetical protein
VNTRASEKIVRLGWAFHPPRRSGELASATSRDTRGTVALYAQTIAELLLLVQRYEGRRAP